MKRILAFSLLCILLIGMLPLSVAAANDMYILAQPQNYIYNVGAVAIYSVTVAGENLKCTWYLDFDGKTYDLSAPNMSDPWSSYVVGDCGSAQAQDNLGFTPTHTTFSYFFNGCEEGLNGAYIYAVIDNGQYMTKSSKAMIQLSEGAKSPPNVFVPAEMTVCKGDKVELECSATAIYGGKLSYTWYETPDGDLTKIQAVNRGAETNATLVCDTNSYGTRYYVCSVGEAGGGSAYSSVIPVTVMESQPTAPTNLSPLRVFYHDGEAREVELLKPTDSNREIVVCLDELADSVSGGLVHFETYTDPLTTEEGQVTFYSSNENIISRFSYRHNGYDNADEVLVLFSKPGVTIITAKLDNAVAQSVTVYVYATRAEANAQQAETKPTETKPAETETTEPEATEPEATETQPTNTENPQSTTRPTAGQDAQRPAGDSAEGGNVWIYICIGLGVVAVGMAVVILLLLKSKKKQ